MDIFSRQLGVGLGKDSSSSSFLRKLARKKRGGGDQTQQNLKLFSREKEEVGIL